ncbi:MarR family winged helix-turn-helix transcriptional regulator [Pseudonocardia sp. CA-107938]|uniref:MarR family winged helix-turn-helix transcriptional regulator n=1 Tax=Pseudonocardia sp. CA-107938 TaxID=3240021 RepID=UPI003D8B38F4
MPDPAELAVAEAVGSHLIRLVRLVERVQAQPHGPDAIERATYLLLVHLVKDGPQRAGALADAVHSDPSTISRQVGHLVKLGYVERTADPDDGRASRLAATEEGRRVLETNRARRTASIAQLLASWSPADRTALAELLGRFVTDFEEYKSRGAHA